MLERDEFIEICAQRRRRGNGSPEHERVVAEIIDSVRKRGDRALQDYTRMYDGCALSPQDFLVSSQELDDAWASIDGAMRRALEVAHREITEYHRHQVPRDYSYGCADGSGFQMVSRPLSSAGVYVPGGTAPYPSSVLMGVIPALIAGVQDIAVYTPPGREGQVAPGILAAARLAGASRVYRLGGAQAIAAMAFGTETIAAVDKIVGPGNSYVTVAKRLVFGHVDIDLLAGPSEILIIADGGSDPAFLAADMLAQAEHDAEATAVLVSLDSTLMRRVQVEISRQIEGLTRRDIASRSLASNGLVVQAMDRKDALKLANAYAPEHLELMLSEPEELLEQVQNAGAVFLGPYTPEAMGDYVSGTNHVLPTGGTARFSSGLSVYSFRKTMSVSRLSKQRFELLAPHGEAIAEAEGLTAHGASMRIRRRCLT